MGNSSTQNSNSENKYKPWTQAETNFLRVNYGKMTAREIGERIGRPIQAVYGKVKAEGIGKLAPCKCKKVPLLVTKEEAAPVSETTPAVVQATPVAQETPAVQETPVTVNVTPEVTKEVSVNGKKCSVELSAVYPMIMSTMALMTAIAALILLIIH